MRHALPALFFSAACLVVPSTRADQVAYTPDQVYVERSSTGTDAFLFRALEPIRVTALGYFDDRQDGLSLVHPVALYDAASGAQLAESDVGPGAFLDGRFRYNAIAPVDLTTGRLYVIAGFHPGGGPDDLDPLAAAPLSYPTPAPGDVAVSPAIDQIFYGAGFDQTLVNPFTPFSDYEPYLDDAEFRGGPLFFGPNFQFQPSSVPEPSGVMMFGAGGLALLALARRGRVPRPAS
jgi:hypothetical protein